LRISPSGHTRGEPQRSTDGQAWATSSRASQPLCRRNEGAAILHYLEQFELGHEQALQPFGYHPVIVGQQYTRTFHIKKAKC
jgi:hypothetical protein